MNAKLDQALANGITATVNDVLLTTTEQDIFVDDTGTSPSVYEHEIAVTVSADIPIGTYTFNIIYSLTENAPDAPTTMADMTQDYCDTLTLNEPMILTDARNNQEYQIAKLADDNCWMLNNLKITPQDVASADSNLNNPGVNTTALAAAGSSVYSYNIPQWYDPTSTSADGNTNIESSTFYGYLYNWCAATGADSATCTADNVMPTDAATSICPANWRLPKGGSVGDVNNEFSQLNAKMAGFADNQDSIYQNNHSNYFSNWQHDGSFKGVLSGYWIAGFVGQDYRGNLWSSSYNPNNPNNARNAFIDPGDIMPGNGNNRGNGFAVRCLLN
jgi:uncharacterized protein (TIGR02145 family)